MGRPRIASPVSCSTTQARSDAEKIKLLLDWRQDLLELQTAAGENMPDQCGEANGATRLQAVMDALITLGYKSE